jgi:hypothetical protein
MTDYVLPSGVVRVEDGIAVRWDGSTVEATPEVVSFLATQAEAFANDPTRAHRAALFDARTLLLAYGTPDGLSFAETYSAVQTAALDYRDSGVKDAECEEHLQWITARTGQITAAALFQAGVLK